jgi:hypothetical protein
MKGRGFATLPFSFFQGWQTAKADYQKEEMTC